MPTNLSKSIIFTFAESRSVVLSVTAENPISSHNGFIDLKHYSSPYGVPMINSTILKNDITFANYSKLGLAEKENLLLQSLISAQAYKDFSHIHPISTEEYLIPLTFEKIIGKNFIVVNGFKVPIIELKKFDDMLHIDPLEQGGFSKIVNLIHTLEFQKRFGHMFINPNISITENILLGESSIYKKFLDPENTWFIEERDVDHFKFYCHKYPNYPNVEFSVVNKISEFMPTLSYIHAHQEYKLENLGGTISKNNNKTKTYDATIMLQNKAGFNLNSTIIDNYSPSLWSTTIHRIYHDKYKNLGLQHPKGKVLVNASYAKSEHYKSVYLHV